eukprot:gene5857-11827_t
MSISIDQLESTLNKAAATLQSSMLTASYSREGGIAFSVSAISRSSLDAGRKNEILQQLGRRPLTNPIRSSDPDYPNDPNNLGSGSRGRYSDPAARQLLINRLLSEHASRSSFSEEKRELFTSQDSLESPNHIQRESIMQTDKLTTLHRPHMTPSDDNSRSFSNDNLFYASDVVTDTNREPNAYNHNIDSSPDEYYSVPSVNATADITGPIMQREFFHEGVSRETSPNTTHMLYSRPKTKVVKEIVNNNENDENDDDIHNVHRKIGKDKYMNQFIHNECDMTSVEPLDNDDDNNNQNDDISFNTTTTKSAPISHRPRITSKLGKCLRRPLSMPRKDKDYKDRWLEESFDDAMVPIPLPPASEDEEEEEKEIEDDTESQAPVPREHVPVPSPFSPTRRRALSPSIRINQLSRTNHELWDKRNKLRQQLAKSEMEDCTFQPRLCPGTKQIAKTKLCKDTEQHPYVNANKPSVVDRLYEDAERRAIQQDWKRSQMEAAASLQHSFQPELNPGTAALSASMDLRPIHERLGNIQRARSERMIELQNMKRYRESNITFHPEINDKSRVLAERREVAQQDSTSDTANVTGQRSHSTRREPRAEGQENRDLNAGTRALEESPCPCPSKDVVSRLMEEGEMAKRRKEQLLREREQQVQNMMTPVKISTGTEVIAKKNPMVSASFNDRQAIHSERVRSHSASRRKEEEAVRETWFHPTVCRKSLEIVKQYRPDETVSQRMDRLMCESLERERRKKELEEKVYGGLVFSPVIDELSRGLGRSASLDELVYNTRGRRAKAKSTQRVIKETNAQCTFTPVTGNASRRRPRSATSLRSTETSLPSAQYGVSMDDNYFDYSSDWLCGCPLQALEASQLGGMTTTRTKAMESSCKGTRPRSPAVINMREPERMARDIRLKIIETDEKRQQQLIAKSVEELRECTFTPRPHKPVPANIHRVQNTVPVRGLERYLGLRDLAARKVLERQHREEEVFGAKKAAKYRSYIDGTTIIKPFRLSEPNDRSSRAVQELEEEERANLTFSPHTVDAYKRHETKELVMSIDINNATDRVNDDMVDALDDNNGYVGVSRRLRHLVN